MPLYGGFYPESAETIEEALSFVRKRIEEFHTDKKKLVDETHHAVIDKELEGELRQIDVTKRILEKQAATHGIYELDAETNESFLDCVRSALEIYLRDTLYAKSQTGLPRFDEKAQEIKRITGLEGLRARRTDLFDRYYQAAVQMHEGRKVEIFLSYSTEDKALAGKIGALLIERGIDVFLAHEDIEISDEWRKEILKHLGNDNVLVALLTPNYEGSVWANQEAGYMMGKVGGRTIPLIVGKTDIKRFGFLEALQGIAVEEQNLKDCVDKIVSVILK